MQICILIPAHFVLTGIFWLKAIVPSTMVKQA